MNRFIVVSETDTGNPFAVLVSQDSELKAVALSEKAVQWQDWVNLNNIESKDALSGLSSNLSVGDWTPSTENNLLKLNRVLGDEIFAEAKYALVDDYLEIVDVVPGFGRRYAVKGAQNTYSPYGSTAPLQKFRPDSRINALNYKGRTYRQDSQRKEIADVLVKARALWDPNIAPNGGWRCPPGTQYGGYITDRFGRGCGVGLIRRVGRALVNAGRGVDRLGEGRDARRLERAAEAAQRGGGARERAQRGVARGMRGVARALEGGAERLMPEREQVAGGRRSRRNIPEAMTPERRQEITQRLDEISSELSQLADAPPSDAVNERMDELQKESASLTRERDARTAPMRMRTTRTTPQATPEPETGRRRGTRPVRKPVTQTQPTAEIERASRRLLGSRDRGKPSRENRYRNLTDDALLEKLFENVSRPNDALDDALDDQVREAGRVPLSERKAAERQEILQEMLDRGLDIPQQFAQEVADLGLVAKKRRRQGGRRGRRRERIAQAMERGARRILQVPERPRKSELEEVNDRIDELQRRLRANEAIADRTEAQIRDWRRINQELRNRFRQRDRIQQQQRALRRASRSQEQTAPARPESRPTPAELENEASDVEQLIRNLGGRSFPDSRSRRNVRNRFPRRGLPDEAYWRKPLGRTMEFVVGRDDRDTEGTVLPQIGSGAITRPDQIRRGPEINPNLDPDWKPDLRDDSEVSISEARELERRFGDYYDRATNRLNDRGRLVNEMLRRERDGEPPIEEPQAEATPEPTAPPEGPSIRSRSRRATESRRRTPAARADAVDKNRVIDIEDLTPSDKNALIVEARELLQEQKRAWNRRLGRPDDEDLTPGMIASIINDPNERRRDTIIALRSDIAEGKFREELLAFTFLNAMTHDDTPEEMRWQHFADLPKRYRNRLLDRADIDGRWRGENSIRQREMPGNFALRTIDGKDFIFDEVFTRITSLEEAEDMGRLAAAVRDKPVVVFSTEFEGVNGAKHKSWYMGNLEEFERLIDDIDDDDLARSVFGDVQIIRPSGQPRTRPADMPEGPEASDVGQVDAMAIADSFELRVAGGRALRGRNVFRSYRDDLLRGDAARNINGTRLLANLTDDELRQELDDLRKITNDFEAIFDAMDRMGIDEDEARALLMEELPVGALELHLVQRLENAMEQEIEARDIQDTVITEAKRAFGDVNKETAAERAQQLANETGEQFQVWYLPKRDAYIVLPVNDELWKDLWPDRSNQHPFLKVVHRNRMGKMQRHGLIEPIVAFPSKKGSALLDTEGRRRDNVLQLDRIFNVVAPHKLALNSVIPSGIISGNNTKDINGEHLYLLLKDLNTMFNNGDVQAGNMLFFDVFGLAGSSGRALWRQFEGLDDRDRRGILNRVANSMARLRTLHRRRNDPFPGDDEEIRELNERVRSGKASSNARDKIVAAALENYLNAIGRLESRPRSARDGDELDNPADEVASFVFNTAERDRLRTLGRWNDRHQDLIDAYREQINADPSPENLREIDQRVKNFISIHMARAANFEFNDIDRARNLLLAEAFIDVQRLIDDMLNGPDDIDADVTPDSVRYADEMMGRTPRQISQGKKASRAVRALSQPYPNKAQEIDALELGNVGGGPALFGGNGIPPSYMASLQQAFGDGFFSPDDSMSPQDFQRALLDYFRNRDMLMADRGFGALVRNVAHVALRRQALRGMLAGARARGRKLKDIPDDAIFEAYIRNQLLNNGLARDADGGFWDIVRAEAADLSLSRLDGPIGSEDVQVLLNERDLIKHEIVGLIDAINTDGTLTADERRKFGALAVAKFGQIEQLDRLIGGAQLQSRQEAERSDRSIRRASNSLDRLRSLSEYQDEISMFERNFEINRRRPRMAEFEQHARLGNLIVAYRFGRGAHRRQYQSAIADAMNSSLPDSTRARRLADAEKVLREMELDHQLLGEILSRWDVGWPEQIKPLIDDVRSDAKFAPDVQRGRNVAQVAAKRIARGIPGFYKDEEDIIRRGSPEALAYFMQALGRERARAIEGVNNDIEELDDNVNNRALRSDIRPFGLEDLDLDDSSILNNVNNVGSAIGQIEKYSDLIQRAQERARQFDVERFAPMSEVPVDDEDFIPRELQRTRAPRRLAKSNLRDLDRAVEHLNNGGDLADVPDEVVVRAVMAGMSGRYVDPSGRSVPMGGRRDNDGNIYDQYGNLINGPLDTEQVLRNGFNVTHAENQRFAFEVVKDDRFDERSYLKKIRNRPADEIPNRLWQVVRVQDKQTGDVWFLKTSTYGDDDALMELIGVAAGEELGIGLGRDDVRVGDAIPRADNELDLDASIDDIFGNDSSFISSSSGAPPDRKTDGESVGRWALVRHVGQKDHGPSIPRRGGSVLSASKPVWKDFDFYGADSRGMPRPGAEPPDVLARLAGIENIQVEDLARIIALDLALNNEDRNAGNLMYYIDSNGKMRLMPMDHGLIGGGRAKHNGDGDGPAAYLAGKASDIAASGGLNNAGTSVLDLLKVYNYRFPDDISKEVFEKHLRLSLQRLRDRLDIIFSIDEIERNGVRLTPAEIEHLEALKRHAEQIIELTLASPIKIQNIIDQLTRWTTK